MKTRSVITVIIAIFGTTWTPQLDVQFDAHEWGLFEFYQGIGVDISAGHEDLPNFVVRLGDTKPAECGKDCKCKGGDCPKDCMHWMGKTQAHCPDLCSGKKCSHVNILVRKPVINIYSKSDFTLRVTAAIRDGKLTFWYPRHTEANQTGEKITWDNIQVTNTKKSLKEAKDSSWWETARDTDSSYVVTGQGEAEKFIFYEGESEKLVPGIEIKREGDKVVLVNKTKHVYKSVLVVKGDKIACLELNKSKEVDFKNTIDKKEARSYVEGMLTGEGLKEREAKGVAKIWEEEFFKKEGLRVIYAMPRKEIDEILQVEMEPKPKNFKRAMIVCVHENNTLIEDLIRKLGSDDPKTRDQATDTLIRLGRPIKPQIENALKDAKDPEVKSRLHRILAEIDKGKGRLHKHIDDSFVKEGNCNGSCDRVHYPHPEKESHLFGAKCLRCEKKIDLCYLLCKECCRALSVCYGCNKRAEMRFKDPSLCKCGRETIKADELKYEIIFSKEGLALNSSMEETRYIARSLAEWKEMVKALGIGTVTSPDFSKEMAVAIDVGKGCKIDLRCVFETEKWQKVIYTVNYPMIKSDEHMVVIVKLARSDKPVYCGAGLDGESEFQIPPKNMSGN